MHPNLLDQLRVFRTIVDCGGFSKGAERLHKTVSSVSYTVSNLEAHLKLTLFDRSSYRLALTKAGESIYADCERLLRHADRFHAHVERLTVGEKAELHLAVDVLFPRDVLLDALSRLEADDFVPAVSVRLAEMNQVHQDVLSGACDMGLVSIDATLSYRDVDGIQIGSTENMLVASPDHALAEQSAPFAMHELENHRQLILALTETPKGQDNYHVHRTEVWTIGDVQTLVGALRKGLGWAYVHRHFVEDDLGSGTLVALNCRDIQTWRLHRFGAVWRVSEPPIGSHERFLRYVKDSFPPPSPRKPVGN